MVWRNRTLYWLFVVFATMVFGRIGAASEDLKVSDLDVSEPAAAATVERICEQAVRNIARRYNLNDLQTEYTNELMKRDVSKFLKEHEEEIWPVIRELLSKNLQPPESVEDLKRIGKVSRKLAKLAKEAIFRANKEWRDILTEDQKKVHDFDLAEMEKTFGDIDENFSAWEEGRRTDKSIFGRRTVPAGGPPHPTRPPDGDWPRGEKNRVIKPTVFDTFVEEFIKDYGLDAAQIEAARSILKEIKAKASDLQNAKKAEFAKIESERNEAFAKANMEGIKQAEAARKRLLEPVYQLFAQLESRLKNLLTSEQIDRYNNMQKTTAEQQAAIEKEPTPKKNATPKKEALPEQPAKKTASATRAQSDKGKSETVKAKTEKTDDK